jgi:Holliday junction resolvasome RuvABC endonuclease subunit
MQVLAIDPGYSRMGLAIGDSFGILTSYDLIETPSNQLFENRLWYAYQALESCVVNNTIELIAYEEPGKLLGKNSLLTPQVIACINLLVAKYNLKCLKYSPYEIKKAATNKVTADKTLVEERALKHFNIDPKEFKLRFGKAKDDVADAIAVYMCYLLKTNISLAA